MVKPFDRRWRDAQNALAGLFFTAAEPKRAATLARRHADTAPPVSLFEKAANVDEFNIIHAADRMGRLGADVRLLMVLADGMTRGSMEALSKSVSAVEAAGTTVIGIGIGDHTVDDAYRRHEVVEEPDQLAKAMVDGTRSALRRSLAISGMDSWWMRTPESRTKEKAIG
jgi:translation initiation factor IF-2